MGDLFMEGLTRFEVDADPAEIREQFFPRGIRINPKRLFPDGSIFKFFKGGCGRMDLSELNFFFPSEPDTD
jgi:hypothetical protein